VYDTLFPPVAEISARLAGNFCQYVTTVTSGKIVWFGWLSAISQLASRVREVWGVGKLCLHSIALHKLTLPGPGGESREGGCVPSPWFTLPLLVFLH
jgi:hypothetical protein